MSGEITKEEFTAMLEVMSKYATNLENIANSFRSTAESLKEVNERLHNGIVKDMTSGVKESLNICLDNLKKDHIDLSKQNAAVLDNTNTMKSDILLTKIFIGISSLVIITATVVLRGLDNRQILGAQLEDKIKIIIQQEMKNEMPKLLKHELGSYRSNGISSNN